MLAKRRSKGTHGEQKEFRATLAGEALMTVNQALLGLAQSALCLRTESEVWELHRRKCAVDIDALGHGDASALQRDDLGL